MVDIERGGERPGEGNAGQAVGPEGLGGPGRNAPEPPSDLDIDNAINAALGLPPVSEPTRFERPAAECEPATETPEPSDAYEELEALFGVRRDRREGRPVTTPRVGSVLLLCERLRRHTTLSRAGMLPLARRSRIAEVSRLPGTVVAGTLAGRRVGPQYRLRRVGRSLQLLVGDLAGEGLFVGAVEFV